MAFFILLRMIVQFGSTRGGHKELVSEGSNEREKGYLYFIDVNGDLARRINPQERDIETKELFKPGTQTVK